MLQKKTENLWLQWSDYLMAYNFWCMYEFYQYLFLNYMYLFVDGFWKCYKSEREKILSMNDNTTK